MTNADKRFSTSGGAAGNFLAGYQTGYTYDEIGNRLTKIEGGSGTSSEGTGTRTTTYTTTNALNQYTAITHPSSGGNQEFHVTGRRDSDADAIKVNNVTADYQANTSTGLHYSKVVSHASSIGTYAGVSVTKTTGGTTTYIESGYSYVPPTPEAPTYDADGNLRQDGHWDYQWDAENRLTSLTTRHTVDGSIPGLRFTYGYDGLSRRIWKKMEIKWSEEYDFGLSNFESYLYDGWNLIMRIDYSVGNETIYSPYSRQSFIWGPDLASRPDGHSSWQKAGGVGGLLMVLDKNATAYTSTGDNYFPLMDRMGNVAGYRSSDNGSSAVLSAVYEYDAFGREMKSLGPAADKMPFRFSTKYTDIESGLVYYGYRYYDAISGRWINRDPIGENGAENLQACLQNALISSIDVLGRVKLDYENKGDVKEGDCGHFVWRIQFILDAPSKLGGIIIQKINVAYNVTDCQGNPIDATAATKSILNPKGFRPGLYPYWEGWVVPPGGDETKENEGSFSNEPDDKISMPSFGDCTKGTIVFTAEATFYEGKTMPSTMAKIPGHPAGDLPATNTDPKLGAGSASLNRNIVATWNCCPQGTVGKTTVRRNVNSINGAGKGEPPP